MSVDETEPSSSRKQRPPSSPPSPISNASSPSRKRPRLSNWDPPSHIPDFLPPFPVIPSEHANEMEQVAPESPQLPPVQLPPARIDKPPSPIPQSVPTTSSSASDYLTCVPYNQSTLSSVPEWHLPSAIPPVHPSQQQQQVAKPSRLVTPQTEPSLIAAYHHILTHPPSANQNASNPARHKVAMALLSHAQKNPRWDPPDTLFSSTAPCAPRVAAMSPTCPVPIGKPTTANVGENSKLIIEEKDGKGVEPKFPVTMGKPVSYIERLSPLISQQASRIPELARHVLSVSVIILLRGY
jgi:hypothetical protein